MDDGMVCHGLPQEVWTYGGSRWTKKATLATSGDNIQGRVGVRDERPDDGLHEATRNNERPTWTPCRWLQNVQLIQYVILPVLRLSMVIQHSEMQKRDEAVTLNIHDIYIFIRYNISTLYY